MQVSNNVSNLNLFVSDSGGEVVAAASAQLQDAVGSFVNKDFVSLLILQRMMKRGLSLIHI